MVKAGTRACTHTHTHTHTHTPQNKYSRDKPTHTKSIDFFYKDAKNIHWRKDLKKKNSFKTLTINGVVKTVYLPAKKTLNHKTP